MERFQEKLIQQKGKQIRFQDVTGKSLTGEVGEVGSDYVIISVSDPEIEKGNKLYNFTNIVWIQAYRE